MVRRSLSLLLLLLLAACALQPVTEPRRSNPAQEPTPLPPPVAAERPTYTVARGIVAERLTLRGRVGSAVEVTLEADQDGTVASVLVADGAAIVAGDVLALLDTRDIDAELALARDRLADAQAQQAQLAAQNAVEAEAAALRLERADLLLDAGRAANVASAELRALEIDVELAQLAVTRLETAFDPELQAAIDALEQQIAALTVARDARRVVSIADGDLRGFTLNLGSRVRTGGTIGFLTAADAPVVRVSVNESELTQLEEGMIVLLTTPDAPDAPFAGRIDTLPFPHGNGPADSDDAIITADDLPPFGSRVDVTITLREETDALWLPPGALREFAGASFVIIREGDIERRSDVETGITADGRIEIVRGVDEGDIVVGP